MAKIPKQRKLAILVAAVVIPAGAFLFVRTTGAAGPSVPTAEAKRGDFVEYLQIRGEIKARNSKILVAPSGAGDLQIIKLAKMGTQIKKDDVIVQFDPTTVQRTLEQKRSELKSADAEIDKQKALGHMSDEQAQTESLAAKYNMQRATLDTNKQEILSVIEGEKARLTLQNSEQKLAESEEKVKSGRVSTDANIEMKKKKRQKAVFDVEQAERQIASMALKAPTDGMVTLLPNFRAGGFFGGNMPDFKEGDRAWPGAAVAEIPDLSLIRFEARIDEADRGKLKPSQEASVRVDAVPEKEFSAKIRDISTLAKLDFSGWPPTKNFAIDIHIDSTDPRIRPGMSANSRVEVSRIPGSLMVPNEAIFQKAGRAVVYVQNGRKFEERVVKVGRRNASSAQIVSGLQDGDKVALKDPTEEGQKR
ncbi:MAG TPA: efflux RND transporter periplasmic adaptor subunit [Terriglobales bacterium]|nr:efflux RND transporter periplasmic adaptor subunit [Terriglobales bacterium]